jgi:hypothetical protein
MGAPPPSTVAMQRIHKTLHVLRTDNEPQVRGGHTSESVRGHARAPRHMPTARFAVTKVLANDRACTRVPLPNFHGKEGSTVRVRQRAWQKSCTGHSSSFLHLHSQQRAVGMEPFMEPSRQEGRGKTSENASFALDPATRERPVAGSCRQEVTGFARAQNCSLKPFPAQVALHARTDGDASRPRSLESSV